MNKSIFFFIKSAFKLNASNLIRLLSITLGLTLSLVIFGEVVYEQTYDNFHAKKDRMYTLHAFYTMGGKGEVSGNKVPDMVIPTIVAQVPEIEFGTRYRYLSGVYKVNNSEFSLSGIRIDSAFFDVFDFEVISGDPRNDFKDPNTVYLSKSKASELFGSVDVVGKMIESDKEVYNIKGVFNDFPKNSAVTNVNGRIDILASIEEFDTYDGWYGGDRNYGFITIKEGASREFVNKKIDDIVVANLDVNEVGAVAYRIVPLLDLFSKSKIVIQIGIILSLMSLILIVVSALNYSLITISSLANRTKEVAIHKYSGATNASVYMMIFLETIIAILISLALSVVLIFALEDMILNNFGVSIENIFVVENLWSCFVVVVMMALVSAVIPAKIFSSVSIMSIFRADKMRNLRLKKILLYFQMVFSVALLSVSAVVLNQYDYVMNKPIGFERNNMLHTRFNLNNIEQLRTLENELSAINGVESFTLASSHPIAGLNGVGITEDGSGAMLFSARELTGDSNFFETHRIKFLYGKPFVNNYEAGEGVVTESFVKKMGWKCDESVIGRTVTVDGNKGVIVGVIEDIEINDPMGDPEGGYTPAPILVHSYHNPYNMQAPIRGLAIMRVTQDGEQIREAITNAMMRIMPDIDAVSTYSYKSTFESKYSEKRSFMYMIMMASIVVLIITSMGLYGFISNELKSKYKEIAIRIVHGADLGGLLYLIYKPIMILVLCAVPVGIGLGYYGGYLYISRNFPQVSMPGWWWFGAISLFVLMYVYLIVVIKSYRTARQNPINAIKSN